MTTAVDRERAPGQQQGEQGGLGGPRPVWQGGRDGRGAGVGAHEQGRDDPGGERADGRARREQGQQDAGVLAEQHGPDVAPGHPQAAQPRHLDGADLQVAGDVQDDAGEQQQGRGRDEQPERGRQPGAQRAAGEAGGLRGAGGDGAEVQGGGPLGGVGPGRVADPPGVDRERQVAGDDEGAGQRVQVGQDGGGAGGGRYGRARPR